MDKKIEIIGTENRYEIKKLTIDKIKEEKNNEKLDEKYYNEENQIYLLENINDFKYISDSIKNKLSSYSQQDKKRKLYDNNTITYNDTLDLLKVDKCLCKYCNNIVLLYYKYKLDKKQWTLDRIDNNVAHVKDNVVICCLKCNLERKNMKQENYIYNKNLKVVKKST